MKVSLYQDAPRESEGDFATWVEARFAILDFKVAHFRPAKTDKGWRTAVSCDGKGYPDYNALKPPRCLFVEIKSENGKVSPEQAQWLNSFAGIEVVETYLWFPSDREEIEAILSLGHVPNLIERHSFKSAWPVVLDTKDSKNNGR